jgi:hypothetical protein
MSKADDLKARAQQFFAELAVSANRPACGDHYRAIITDLLKQAQSQGLYTPEQP